MPKLELELKKGSYRTQLSGIEANYAYGIICYLNGKRIESD
jgi:hypothetical protein